MYLNVSTGISGDLLVDSARRRDKNGNSSGLGAPFVPLDSTTGTLKNL